MPVSRCSPTLVRATEAERAPAAPRPAPRRLQSAVWRLPACARSRIHRCRSARRRVPSALRRHAAARVVPEDRRRLRRHLRGGAAPWRRSAARRVLLPGCGLRLFGSVTVVPVPREYQTHDSGNGAGAEQAPATLSPCLIGHSSSVGRRPCRPAGLCCSHRGQHLTRKRDTRTTPVMGHGKEDR
jgi:hypothetical protein